jgi:hypothetical protein
MKSTKISAAAQSVTFQELAASELASVEGGYSIAFIGIPFFAGCIISDSLWGEDSVGLVDILEQMK